MSRSLRDLEKAIADLDNRLRGQGPVVVFEGGIADYISCVCAFREWRWLRVARPGEDRQSFHDRCVIEAGARGGRVIRFGGLPPMPETEGDLETIRAERWWRVR